MGWWSTFLGFFTSAGDIAGAVEEGEQVVSKGEDLVATHNEDVAGQDHVTAVDNAQVAKVDENVAKAIVDTDDTAALKLLRDGSG